MEYKPIVDGVFDAAERYPFTYNLTWGYKRDTNTEHAGNQLTSPIDTKIVLDDTGLENLILSCIKNHAAFTHHTKNAPTTISIEARVTGTYFYEGYKKHPSSLEHIKRRMNAPLQRHIFEYNIKTKTIKNLTHTYTKQGNTERTDVHLNTRVPLNVCWGAQNENESVVTKTIVNVDPDDTCDTCSNKFRCSRFKPDRHYGSNCKLTHKIMASGTTDVVSTKFENGWNQQKLKTYVAPRNTFNCDAFDEYVLTKIDADLNEKLKRKNEKRKCDRELKLTKNEINNMKNAYIKRYLTDADVLSGWVSNHLISFETWCKLTIKQNNKKRAERKRAERKLVEPKIDLTDVKLDPVERFETMDVVDHDPRFTPDVDLKLDVPPPHVLTEPVSMLRRIWNVLTIV